MRRGRVFLLIFLVGAVALSLAGPAIYGYFVAERFSDELARAIRVAAATRTAWPGRVNLAKLPAPAWEAVYVFAPYTPPDQIEADLGFPWRHRAAKHISASDTENLLVFVKRRAVVMSVLFPRALGDFGPEARRLKYASNEAQFTVLKEDGRLFLRPGVYTEDMARISNHAAVKPYISPSVEWAAFDRRMRPKLGQRVTASGIPAVGKYGWWLPLEGGAVYLIDLPDGEEARLEEARAHAQAVTVSGTLRFREGSHVDDPRVIAAAALPIFNLEAIEQVTAGAAAPSSPNEDQEQEQTPATAR